MQWSDRYFNWMLGLEMLIMASSGAAILVLGNGPASELYLWEVFSAVLAFTITTFGLKHMKALTS